MNVKFSQFISINFEDLKTEVEKAPMTETEKAKIRYLIENMEAALSRENNIKTGKLSQISGSIVKEHDSAFTISMVTPEKAKVLISKCDREPYPDAVALFRDDIIAGKYDNCTVIELGSNDVGEPVLLQGVDQLQAIVLSGIPQRELIMTTTFSKSLLSGEIIAEAH